MNGVPKTPNRPMPFITPKQVSFSNNRPKTREHKRNNDFTDGFKNPVTKKYYQFHDTTLDNSSRKQTVYHEPVKVI